MGMRLSIILIVALSALIRPGCAFAPTFLSYSTKQAQAQAQAHAYYAQAFSPSRTPLYQSSKSDSDAVVTVTRSKPALLEDPPLPVTQQSQQGGGSFSYVDFAQNYPFANNIFIATTKTAAADLIAQTVIAQTPIAELDVQRSLLFCLFGATYLGGFQYLYQVQIFKRLFDVDRFTNQSWSEKLQDKAGLQALAAQTALDMTILTFIYLPTFYIFKASVFSGGGVDPAAWVNAGLDNYLLNFAKDERDLIAVWLPADLICFSVPLYLRLPVRHVVSFVWTAYLSFARGGH